jgi:histidinol-phosphate aminotransferase
MFMTERAGGELVMVDTVDGHQDLAGLARAVDDRTRLVVLTNPHSPIGTHVGDAALSAFVASLPEHVVVVIDEAYCEYADAPDFPDGAEFVRSGAPVIVTRTFSKAFALAGMRIGYAITTPALAARLRSHLPPFAVNAASIAAATAAWNDRDHLARVVGLNATERSKLTEGFRALGLTAYDSQSNFVLIVGLPDAEALAEQLERRGLIVRPTGDEFKGAGGLRVTTGTSDENDRLLAAMRDLIA